MSFSKSKVSRFGSTPGTACGTPRPNAPEFSRRSREAARPQSGKPGLISSSFIDGPKTCASQTTSMQEARHKSKSASNKLSSSSSKIGRPNLLLMKKGTATKCKSETAETSSNYESTRCTTGSKIPTASQCRSRGNSSVSGSSFIGTPSSTKSSEKTHRDLFNQFKAKTKRLTILRHELLERQKPAIELYKAMIDLKNRIKETEGKDVPLEELKVVEYPDIRILSDEEKVAEIDKLKDMKTKLLVCPNAFLDICRTILDEKCGILDKIFDEDGQWSQDDLIRKIQSYKEDSALLTGRIESRLLEEEGKMKELIREWINMVKLAAHLEEGYTTKAELEAKLQECEQKLKQVTTDLQTEKSKKSKEYEKAKNLEKELAKIKEELLETATKLEEEKKNALNYKEKFNTSEQRMKTLKNRVKDAEAQRQDLEANLEELTRQTKDMENQWNSRETYLEIRHKELQEIVKTQREDIKALEDERHSINVRLTDMEKTNQEKDEKIEALIKELEETKQQKEIIQKECEGLQNDLLEKEAQHQVVSLPTKRNYDEGDIKSPTEIALWEDLKETKSALRIAEEKLNLYNDEKSRFMNSFSENYKENEAAINLTTQLIYKEELITSLLMQSRKQEESFKELHEELKVLRGANKSLEEKNRVLTMQLYESDEQAEKKVYDIHAKLKCELNRNAELEKQLQRSNFEKDNINEMIQDYENLLKIRDGLLNMMQEKKQGLEEQNKNLKEYVMQMRDQMNLLNIDNSKKEQELKTMTMLLEEKTGYIDKIEQRVDELEASVQQIKAKRVNVEEEISISDAELKFTKQRISQLIDEQLNNTTTVKPSNE